IADAEYHQKVSALSSLAAQYLLNNVVTKVKALEQVYNTAKGGRKTHLAEIQKLIADVNSVNTTANLSDMEKYQNILDIVINKFNTLETASQTKRKPAESYATYLN